MNESNKLLQVGDVLYLGPGASVRTLVPEKIFISNKRNSNKLIGECIIIGRVYKYKKERFIFYPGKFVVIKTVMDGGGTGMGPHDTFPDGHHVFCKKLKNDKYNDNGPELDFYQTGCFHCVNPHITPIGKMKQKFI